MAHYILRMFDAPPPGVRVVGGNDRWYRTTQPPTTRVSSLRHGERNLCMSGPSSNLEES